MRKEAVSVLRKDGLIQRKWPLIHILKGIDIIGNLFRLIVKRREPLQKAKINKVLIVHFGGFGDGIFLLSLKESLIKLGTMYQFDLFTNTDVALAVKDSSAFKNVYVSESFFKLQYIKNISKITSKLKQINKKYDVAIALRSGMDNGLLPLFLSGITKSIAGFKTGGFGFCLDIIAEWSDEVHETENYCKVFEAAGIAVTAQTADLNHNSVDNVTIHRPYSVVHMGSKEKFKMLNVQDVDNLLNALLTQTSLDILLTGLESERYIYSQCNLSNTRIIDLMGKQNFQEFKSTLLHASGVVTIDTAAAHIAATRVPTLVFFSGIVSHLEFQPLGERVTVTRNPVICAPCYKPCVERECMSFNVHKITEKWLQDTGLSDK